MNSQVDMIQCSHCQTELENKERLYIERKAFRGAHRVGDFCSYSCGGAYIEEENLNNVKLNQPIL